MKPIIHPRADLGHPINQGLVRAYHVAGDAGTGLLDSMGTGYHKTMTSLEHSADGAYVGSPIGGRVITASVAGADCIVIERPFFATRSDWTFAFWLNKAAGGTNWTHLYGEGNSTTNNPGFLIGKGTTESLYVGIINDAAAGLLNLNSTNPAFVGSWRHIAVVHKYENATTSRVTIYQNGVPDGTATYVNTTSVTLNRSALFCFPRIALGSYAVGTISGFRVWSRALSATEIPQLAADHWLGYYQPVPLAREWSGEVNMVLTGAGVALRELFDGTGFDGAPMVMELEMVNPSANPADTVVGISWIEGLNVQTLKEVGHGQSWNGRFMFQVPYYKGCDVTAYMTSSGAATSYVRASGRLL